METTKVKEEPCRQTEELVAKLDLVAEKKLLREYGKPKAAPAPQILYPRGLPTDSEEVNNLNHLVTQGGGAEWLQHSWTPQS